MTKDGQSFVEGISEYLRQGGKKSSIVPKIQTLLGKVSSAARKEKIAYVETASRLSEEENEELRKVLSNIVGHDLSIDSSINRSLIAGLKIKIADFIIDTSYSSQINEMGEILMR